MKARASHSTSEYEGNLYVFGGQDDDNNKLDDMWCFNAAANAWKKVEYAEGGCKPVPRAGHTAIVCGTKLYVFGGIFELTKELNDLCIFDLVAQQWCQAAEDPFGDGNKEEGSEAAAETQQQQMENSSPLKRQQTLAMSSPNRRTTKKLPGQPMDMSPPPKKRNLSISKKEKGGVVEDKKDGLSSPTSLTMQQSFIIKNADDSFDAYYQSMRKRQKGMTMGGTTAGASPTKEGTMSGTQFGFVSGQPTARDGHSANCDSQGCMYIFGGDRH